MITSAMEVNNIFKYTFDQTPELIFSPGRINLIGEHVDYNDGFVMPAAIDKGIWFAAAANDTGKMHVYSADMDETLEIDLNEIHKIDGWKNYILGVVDQVLKQGHKISGFNAVFGGNLPLGAGLSSSAAVECGLAFALNKLFDLNISRVDIALLSQKAEHTFPGVQCGIMDQFANMMGKQDHVLLLDCNSLEYQELPFAMNEFSILLINSKVHHELASGEYNIRRKQCEEGLEILKKKYPEVKTFRDVLPQQVIDSKNELGDDIFKRCLYVTQEIQRTRQAAEALKANDLKKFGALMFETHDGLSKLYDVSCSELDFLVDQAKNYPEVIGSRLMGGGFGGCTINIIKNQHIGIFKDAIQKAYKENFFIDPEIYQVKPVDGTHLLQ